MHFVAILLICRRFGDPEDCKHYVASFTSCGTQDGRGYVPLLIVDPLCRRPTGQGLCCHFDLRELKGRVASFISFPHR